MIGDSTDLDRGGGTVGPAGRIGERERCDRDEEVHRRARDEDGKADPLRLARKATGRGRVRLVSDTVSTLPGGVPRDESGGAFASAMVRKLKNV